MKNLILILLLTLTISCKKKEITPPPPPPPPCTTKSKVLEGKYRLNDGSHDTITIIFSENLCPNNNSNRYFVYDLNKAIQTSVTHTLNLSYVYIVTSNEDAKTASINGYEPGFIRPAQPGNQLDIFLPNEGEFYFTKIN